MYEMIGYKADGMPYKTKFSNNANFVLRLNEIEADPDRHFPHVITGTRAEEKLPAYLRNYLLEHDAGYLQVMPDAEKHIQERCYNLVIRTDPVMPEEMGAMISQYGSKTIINVGVNATRIEQLASFLHECVHLFRDDLSKGQSRQTAAELEQEAEADLVQAARLITERYDKKQVLPG